jgi:uncharacterized membrane protein YdbT with pleckstrin-like domain
MSVPGPTLLHERIVARERQHWAVFLVPALPLCFFLVLFCFALAGQGRSYLFLLSLVFLAMGVADLTKAAVEYFTTDLSLTDRRIVIRSGLIRRRHLEILLHKVESITVGQPLLGRALDYGTVTVVGTGGTGEKVRSLRHPFLLRDSIYQVLESARQVT